MGLFSWPVVQQLTGEAQSGCDGSIQLASVGTEKTLLNTSSSVWLTLHQNNAALACQAAWLWAPTPAVFWQLGMDAAQI